MLPGSTLWKRIDAFRLDAPEAEFPFSSKLQRETGWDPNYVQLAIQEYKRFVYLACVAGHPVSPSKDVDEVWHLHLTYTRSYWEEFCPKVLERSLHHEPSSGGAEEDAKYHDWYDKTLESYERVFEEPAPDWIWPRSATRTEPGEPRKEKDMSRWCGLLKALSGAYPAFLKKRFWAALFGVFLIGGCASDGAAPNPFEWNGPEFLHFYWGLSLVLLVGGWIWRNTSLQPEDDGGEFPEDRPYLAARLAAGDARALKAALVALQRRRIIAVSDEGRIFRVPEIPAPVDPFEGAIWTNAGGDGIQVRDLWRSLSSELKQLDDELIRRGLLMSVRQRTEAYAGFALIIGILLLVGLIKCGIGLSRGKPIDFLVVSMVGLLAVYIYILANAGRGRSKRGEAYLRRLRANVDENINPVYAETAVVILGIALVGDAFLPVELKSAFAAAFPSNGGAGCGGGSSCGGGGCGGGGCGGGCGGCGGG